MAAQVIDSIVFVVRIWPGVSQGDGFRALVRRIDGEQSQTFDNPGELLRYLTRDPWQAPPVDAGDAPPPGRSGGS